VTVGVALGVELAVGLGVGVGVGVGVVAVTSAPKLPLALANKSRELAANANSRGATTFSSPLEKGANVAPPFSERSTASPLN
jgi:hypothetical protein